MLVILLESCTAVAIDSGYVVIKEGTAFILHSRPYVVDKEVVFHQTYSFAPLMVQFEEQGKIATTLEGICKKFKHVFFNEGEDQVARMTRELRNGTKIDAVDKTARVVVPEAQATRSSQMNQPSLINGTAEELIGANLLKSQMFPLIMRDSEKTRKLEALPLTKAKPTISPETSQKYRLIFKQPVSKYQAQKMCEVHNMKLPEPLVDQELVELGQYIALCGVEQVYLGTFFDQATHTHRFIQDGRALVTMFETPVISTTVELSKEPWKVLTDDSNLKFLVTFKGELRIDPMAETSKAMSRLREQPLGYWHIQKEEYKREPSDVLKAEARPVVCEKVVKPSYIHPEESTSLHYNQPYGLNSISTHCEELTHRIRFSRAQAVDKLLSLLMDFGLEVEPISVAAIKVKQKRAKRFAVLAIAKLGWDMYNSYVTEKRFRRIEQQIAIDKTQLIAHTKELLQHSNQLSVLTSDVQRLEAVQKEILSALKMVSEEIVLIKYTQLLDQVLLHTSSLLSQAEINIATALQELTDVLTSAAQSQIPRNFVRAIRHYLEIKDKPVETLQQRKTSPIGIYPVVEDYKIHLFASFLEGKDRFDLYEVIPLPYFKDGLSYRRTINYNFALVDSRQAYYTPLTSLEAKECETGICTVKRTAHRTSDDKCGVVALSDIRMDPKCPFEEGIEEPFLRHTPQGLLYAVPRPITGRLSCLDELDVPGREGTVVLKEMGMISIPPGCSIISDAPFLDVPGPPRKIIRKMEGLIIVKETPFEDFKLSPKANVTSLAFNHFEKKTHTLGIVLMIVGIIVILVIGVILTPMTVKMYLIRRSVHRVKKRATSAKTAFDSEVGKIKENFALDVGTILHTIQGMKQRMEMYKPPTKPISMSKSMGSNESTLIRQSPLLLSTSFQNLHEQLNPLNRDTNTLPSDTQNSQNN